MLTLIYFSNVSNYTHRFMEQLDWSGEVKRIPIRGEFEETLTSPYVLICPSYGDVNRGHVPVQVRKFLNNAENRAKCVGIIGAGNITFGTDYGKAGNVLSQKLQVPLLYKFELAGTDNDIEQVLNGLQKFEETLTSNNTINQK